MTVEGVRATDLSALVEGYELGGNRAWHSPTLIGNPRATSDSRNLAGLGEGWDGLRSRMSSVWGIG